MAFNTNLWDIVKTFALIGLAGFIWVKGSALVDSLTSKPEVPAEVLVQMESNKNMIANLRANNAEARALIAQLKAEKGEQSRLLEYVEEENKKKDAHLEELGVVVAKLERSVEKLRSEATVAKAPRITGDEDEDKRREELSYEFKKIYTKDSEGNEFPYAWAMYFPNKPKEERWKVGTYDVEFYATVVESETEQGTYDRAVEMHIENNFLTETKGKEYPIQITDFKWEKFEKVEKRMRWWNPRIGFGGLFTNKDIAPKLDLSLSSFGRTKRDMDWRFFVFGVGVSQDDEDDVKIIGSFEPLSWNIGNILPIIENLFVGVALTYDTENETTVGASVSIPF